MGYPIFFRAYSSENQLIILLFSEVLLKFTFSLISNKVRNSSSAIGSSAGIFLKYFCIRIPSASNAKLLWWISNYFRIDQRVKKEYSRGSMPDER